MNKKRLNNLKWVLKAIVAFDRTSLISRASILEKSGSVARASMLRAYLDGSLTRDAIRSEIGPKPPKVRRRHDKMPPMPKDVKKRIRWAKRVSYAEYIASDWWKQRRLRKLESVGFICERCGVSGKITQLDVHHKHYGTKGNECDQDLEVLCHDVCHADHHLHEVLEPIFGNSRPGAVENS